MNGLIWSAGGIGFLRIALWQSLHIFDYGKYHWLVGLTVGCALIGVVLWGPIVGGMLPFLLRRCGFAVEVVWRNGSFAVLAAART